MFVEQIRGSYWEMLVTSREVVMLGIFTRSTKKSLTLISSFMHQKQCLYYSPRATEGVSPEGGCMFTNTTDSSFMIIKYVLKLTLILTTPLPLFLLSPNTKKQCHNEQKMGSRRESNPGPLAT